MNILMPLWNVWESQVELNDMIVQALKMLAGDIGINRTLIIIIIIWLLIVTYKLFKKQQKTV